MVRGPNFPSGQFRNSLKFNTLICLLWVSPLFASVEDEAAKMVDQFHDLQFVQAQKSADRLEALDPAYPAGAFYRSIAYYKGYLLEDPRNPKTFQLFLDASDLSHRRAVNLLSVSPAISHYYQGAALGFQARAFIAKKR